MITTLSQLRATYFPNSAPTSHRIPLPDGGALHLAPLAPPHSAFDQLLDDWTPLTLDAVHFWYSREQLAVLVATTDYLLLFCGCHRASFEAHREVRGAVQSLPGKARRCRRRFQVH